MKKYIEESNKRELVMITTVLIVSICLILYNDVIKAWFGVTYCVAHGFLDGDNNCIERVIKRQDISI